MRYAEAKLKERQELDVYRIFVTDALNNIPQQRFSQVRFYDLIKKKDNPQDERSGDEIAEDIIQRLGLHLEE